MTVTGPEADFREPGVAVASGAQERATNGNTVKRYAGGFEQECQRAVLVVLTWPLGSTWQRRQAATLQPRDQRSRTFPLITTFALPTTQLEPYQSTSHR